MSNEKIYKLTNLLITVGVGQSLAKTYGEAYNKFFKKYDITTPARISAFLGNVLLECDYLRRLTENLNYSAQGLANTWPNRYSVTRARPFKPNNLALSLNRKPQAIANNCYANRMGNGSEASGDGWRYRGRGPIQTTGKNGYLKVKEGTGLDVIKNPDLLTTVEGGAEASCFYWKINNLNKYADNNDFDGVCDLINIGRKTTKIGDSIHYSTRLSIYKKALEWFKSNKVFFDSDIPEDEVITNIPEEPVVEQVNINPLTGWVVGIEDDLDKLTEEEILKREALLKDNGWRPTEDDVKEIKLY